MPSLHLVPYAEIHILTVKLNLDALDTLDFLYQMLEHKVSILSLEVYLLCHFL